MFHRFPRLFSILPQFILFHSYRASEAFFVIDTEVTVFKSFKPTRIRSNVTFSPYVSQIILYASVALFFFGENKTKGSGEYVLYLALFLIVLNVKLC